MRNEKNYGLKNENLVIPEINTDTVHEPLSAERQEEGNVEEQREKARVEAETEKIYSTDPQQKMEGPISSIMQNIKEAGENTDVVSKEEADRKKEENT